MNKIVLITGGSGLLGANLCAIFKNKFNTFFTFNKNPVKISGCKEIKLDLTDYEKTRQKIYEIKPNILIHCAALTNVDYCEEHPKETRLMNYEVTKNLAQLAKEIGAKLVYISTDFVFDGKKGDYTEKDKTNPINVYAKNKLLGEKIITEICKNYLIVRTCIYGCNILNKQSLAEWILGKLEKNEEISGFNDLFFTPILVNNLGEAILEMCERDLKGTYNVTGSEKCSKYEFAKKISEIFGYKDDKIKPANSENFNFKATRPKDASLNIEKAKNILKTRLLNIDEGIINFKKLKEKGFMKTIKG